MKIGIVAILPLLADLVLGKLFLKVTEQAAYADLPHASAIDEGGKLNSTVNEPKGTVKLASHNAKSKGPHSAHEAASDPWGPPPAWVENPLAQFFFRYTTGYKIWKWHHYFRVYHRHLSSLLPYSARGERINMLVIGVQSGGEIGMWQDYFGHNFHYYGIDINPACKKLETAYSNTQIFIGDQSDVTLLLQVKDKILQDGGPIHVIMDDGSHINWHQILTFETLFPFLNGYGGVYMVEDATTSYSAPNSVHRQNAPQLVGVPGVMSTQETLVEHMKTRVDFVNGYWAGQHNPAAAAADPFVQSVNEIAFYDALVVVEKFPHPHPTQEQRGSVDIPYCTAGQMNGCMT